MRTKTLVHGGRVAALCAVLLSGACALDWEVHPGGSSGGGGGSGGASSGTQEITCANDTPCVCDAGESCKMSCDTANCDISCEAGATCAITCSSATCNIECKSGSSCAFHCSAAECITECATATECTQDCPLGATCTCNGCD